MPRKTAPVAAPALDPDRYVPVSVLGAYLFPEMAAATVARRMQRFAHPQTVNGVAVRMRVRHVGRFLESRLRDWDDYQSQIDEAKFGAAGAPLPAPPTPTAYAKRAARAVAEAYAACGVDPD